MKKLCSTISGKVVRGKGKGKQLGFPTVNIEIGNKDFGSGVYAGLARVDGKTYKAGIFIGKDKGILEAHLINFSGDLYGREIKVEIGEKIRDVMKFENDEELKQQIEKDIKLIETQSANLKAQNHN